VDEVRATVRRPHSLSMKNVAHARPVGWLHRLRKRRHREQDKRQCTDSALHEKILYPRVSPNSGIRAAEAVHLSSAPAMASVLKSSPNFVSCRSRD
jgi:hypothetical protein